MFIQEYTEFVLKNYESVFGLSSMVELNFGKKV